MGEPLDTTGLKRRARPPSAQMSIFGGEIEPDWKDEWWGMPCFTLEDARPSHRVVVNFMTREDLAAFAELLGIRVSTKSDSVWYPPENLDRPKLWRYVDEHAVSNLHPVEGEGDPAANGPAATRDGG